LEFFILLLLFLFAALFFRTRSAKKLPAINAKVDAGFLCGTGSLFKNFPNANVTLEKLVIINKAPLKVTH
jgi:hypothetical protein